MVNSFKLLNNNVVLYIGGFISVTSIFIISKHLINIIQPFLMSGYIGTIQLYTIAFCLGYGGTMLIDNILKICWFK
jgi:predicted tellurium resistance membrane protein TerC